MFWQSCTISVVVLKYREAVFISNWITRYGVPIEFLSDQGRHFESALIREMCQKSSIRKTPTTALYPKFDGMVERFNRTLEEHLRKVVDKYQKDWDTDIFLFVKAYRKGNRLPLDLKLELNANGGRKASVKLFEVEIKKSV